ncbi:MAG: ZIP family metal transporter [Candidatus Bathyarchaeota archaeon]
MIGEVFLLSLIAGSATVIGGILVVLLRRISDRFIAASMGFASGVMLLVSFLNLFVESLELASYLNVSLAFTAGSIIMIIIDLFLPHLELGKREDGILEKSKQLKPGILILIGITIHNIPEGIVVSTGYSHLPQLGTLIAIAVFFHNLPEGIATAVSLASGGSRKRDIVLATFVSGLAEPVGALLGGTILIGASNEMIGLALAFAAGVMTYITADELIPIAGERGHKHTMSVGLLLGIIFIMILNNALR